MPILCQIRVCGLGCFLLLGTKLQLGAALALSAPADFPQEASVVRLRNCIMGMRQYRLGNPPQSPFSKGGGRGDFDVLMDNAVF